MIHLLVTYYLYFIIGYVVAGCAYATVKWTFLLLKLRSKISGVTEAPTNWSSLQSWRESQTTRVGFSGSSYPPLVSENKGLLSMWAIFWIVNLPYTLFADVLREAFSWVYRKCGTILQAISNSILPK